jgi:hypothetical protein
MVDSVAGVVVHPAVENTVRVPTVGGRVLLAGDTSRTLDFDAVGGLVLAAFALFVERIPLRR